LFAINRTLADVFEWNESGPVQGRSLLPCLLEPGARAFAVERLRLENDGWERI
jgi:hypothetical protein